MKKKYDIRINPEPLSSEEIARHQDFDRMFALYEQQPTAGPPSRPRIRPMVWVTTLAAAAVAGWFLYTSVLQPDSRYDKEASEFFAQQEFVAPPQLATARPDFVARTVNAVQGGEVIYDNGSRLQVPADAFEGPDGQPVAGDVEIRFREMHDYVDFFLSGIPMVYDSAGVRYTLESAGMLEIYAEQDGQRVKIRPGKSIDVELVSELRMPFLEIPPGYNIYKLDTAARRWDYQDIDRMQIVESMIELSDDNHPLYQIQEAHAQELAELEAEKQREISYLNTIYPVPEVPEEPALYDPNKFVFDFEMPGETGEHLGTLWQLAPGQDIAAETLNRPWDGMKIEQVNNRDFRLELTATDQQLEVMVIPVRSGSSYEIAMEAFRLEMKQYQEMLAEREDQLNAERIELQNRFALERTRLQAEFEAELVAFRDESQLEQMPTMRHKVINRFQANSFGIWNCDRPVAPRMASINGTFQDQAGNVLKGQVAYLANKSRNTIEQIYLAESTPLQFDANSDNLLWIVTEDQQIAYIRPEEFAEIDLEQDAHTFVLQDSNRRVESEADLREILYF